MSAFLLKTQLKMLKIRVIIAIVNLVKTGDIYVENELIYINNYHLSTTACEMLNTAEKMFSPVNCPVNRLIFAHIYYII